MLQRSKKEKSYDLGFDTLRQSQYQLFNLLRLSSQNYKKNIITVPTLEGYNENKLRLRTLPDTW